MTCAVLPHFIDSSAGRIFTLYFEPRKPVRGALLYLPPFAEEMNRCRTLAAAQARALSDVGYACLLLDYFGTGDSGGELSGASWSIWQTDVLAAAKWLEQEAGTPVTLWGCRLGALLAADVASRHPGRFCHLLFWQPVINGKMYMTQFLRLRVASLMNQGLPPENTDQMRMQLASGQPVAVSGYMLSAGIANEVDRVSLIELSGLEQCHIDWLENVDNPGGALPLASQKTVNALSAQGVKVVTQSFTAPPVWQLHKRDAAPDLLLKTASLFGI